MNMDIGIVLTGTIKPNSNFVAVKSVDERRKQYLEAIKYYCRFCPVWFLENSEYDIESDNEFKKIDGLIVVKCPVSKAYDKGKGYQEFEMLDRFFLRNDIPEIIIKVTGRYIIDDFSRIVRDSLAMDEASVLIDLHKKYNYADTYLLTFKTSYYRKNLMGLFKRVNDSIGIYVEHIYYEYFMKHQEDCRLYKNECDIYGVSGSSGKIYEHRAWWKKFLKSCIRICLVIKGVKTLPW